MGAPSERDFARLTIRGASRMRGGLGDALIGLLAILLATFIYAIERALGYKPSPADFGNYPGMSVSLIMYPYSAIAVASYSPPHTDLC
jgi:hypothetical protein